MANIKSCFSKKTDHWKTPKEIYEYFIKELYCIDPCPYMSKDDNLEKIYKEKNIFINPPYSQIDKWIEFIINNLKTNNYIWLLIPARTDTKYFHKLMQLKNKNASIYLYFIKGRLHFNDTKDSAPFPSVIIEIKYYKSFDGEIKTYFIKQEDIKEYILDI